MVQSNKPITQILIKHKEHQNLVDFATMLETIAKKLREEQKFVFVQGDKETEIIPAEQVKVEYEYTVKGDKHSFEIEIDWLTGENAKTTMKIE